MDDNVLATQCITLQSNSYSTQILIINYNISGWNIVPETEESNAFVSRLTEQIW